MQSSESSQPVQIKLANPRGFCAGVDRAIDAARALGVALHVAGDGPARAALEARARGADVRFHGVRTGVEKAELLRAADVFVAPSRSMPDGRTEGTPVALLEAALTQAREALGIAQ